MSLPRPALSPAAVALLNAIATAAPTSVDPWERYPAVLRVKHVAEILGIDPESVRNMARKRRLPMVKRPGGYMIDQVEFRRWVGYRDSRSAS